MVFGKQPLKKIPFVNEQWSERSISLWSTQHFNLSGNLFQIRHLLLKEAEWHMTRREAKVEFSNSESDDSLHKEENSCVPGRGIAQDLRKKLRFYASDYLDGWKILKNANSAFRFRHKGLSICLQDHLVDSVFDLHNSANVDFIWDSEYW